MAKIDKEAESVLPQSLRAMAGIADRKWEGWGEIKHLGQGRVNRLFGTHRVEGSPPAGWNVLTHEGKEVAIGLSLTAAKLTAEGYENERNAKIKSETERMKALADKARAAKGANVVAKPEPKPVIEGVSPIKQPEPPVFAPKDKFTGHKKGQR